MTVWRYWNENPKRKHTGDCVVRAIALVTGQSWDETYKGLCAEGFDRCEMPSWNPTWWAYLRGLGYARHVIPDSCPDCYTVGDFAKDHPDGRFVLYIPSTAEGVGHAVAAVDGDVYDTWDSTQEVPLVYWSER